MPADALPATTRGAGDRLVLVHGFTQTGRSWAPVVDRLADRFELVALDAPGHGDASGVDVDLWRAGELVAATGAAATYVGYSMGGRICLHAALVAPAAVRRLVLVSTTAGIDDPGERAARRETDEVLAASIERDGVDAFVERWLAGPLFATLKRDAAGVEDRRRNTAAGLAASLRRIGTGAQTPLWDRLGELGMPVLVVAGEHDERFVTLAARLHGAIPGSTLAVVAGAGHTVHLEQPDAFADLVARFCA